MPNRPSQLCQDCNGKGATGSPRLFAGTLYGVCPMCSGKGFVTIQRARMRRWKIVHRARLKKPSQAQLSFDSKPANILRFATRGPV